MAYAYLFKYIIIGDTALQNKVGYASHKQTNEETLQFYQTLVFLF